MYHRQFVYFQIYALNKVMTELEQQQFEAFCKQMQAAGDSWPSDHAVMDRDQDNKQNLALSKNQVLHIITNTTSTLCLTIFYSVLEATGSDSLTVWQTGLVPSSL